MKIGIATDHNGVEEKKILTKYLSELGYEVKDYSVNNTPIDDYPDFAAQVSRAVINNEIEQGILMCGTGIGMSITANKFKGIRCAKISTKEEAILAREHNNANVIALSYKMPIDELKEILKYYLKTEYTSDERHVRRLNRIKEIENQNV